MEIMDNFFGRSGTMQGALDMADSIKSMKSESGMQRLQGIKGVGEALYNLVNFVIGLF